MRQLRLKAVWLLVLPFLWFARPTPGLMGLGAALTLVGLLVRAWAAGTIHKDQDLTTSGPYAFTRNPLYVGSFIIGGGVTLAGSHWVWPALFFAFFTVVYERTMREEILLLTERFGDRYREYAAEVPALIPRLTPYRPETADRAGGFRFAQYRRNKEWEAALGAFLTFAVLAGKWWLWG